MIYLRLFLEFFKAGLFAVGGGLATLPFLSDMATSTGWFTHSQLADMVAVSESTPGPLGVNMATYVGYTVKGVPGAVIATLGLITPSVIIILVIALFLKSFRHNHFVEAAFECLRPASLGLITASGIAVAVTALFVSSTFEKGFIGSIHWKAIPLSILLLLVTRVFKKTKGLHPIIWIGVSAVVGIVFSFAGV